MTAVTRTTSRPLLRPAAPRPGGEQFCLRNNEVPCDLEVAGNTDYGVTLGTRSCSVALLLPLVGTLFPISSKVLQPGGETTVGARELQLVFVFFRGSPKLGQTKSTRGRWGRLETLSSPFGLARSASGSPPAARGPSGRPRAPAGSGRTSWRGWRRAPCRAQPPAPGS